MIDREELLKKIITENSDYVKFLAYKYFPIPGEGDDIAQEVFVDLLKKKDEWDLAENIRPLLAGITRIAAKRRWRERYKEMSSEKLKFLEYLQVQLSQEEQKTNLFERKSFLRKCMEKLNNKSREILDLYYYDDLPVNKVAERLGTSINTILVTLFRIRKQLKHCIEFSSQGGEING